MFRAWFILSSGTYASAMGKYWHVNHLLCSRCNRPLGGDGSFRMDEGEIICRDCFEQKVAKICAKCNQAILAVSTDEYCDIIAKLKLLYK